VTVKPKQIVLDKSAFIAFTGHEFDALCDFSRHHVLLLSDTLLYECTTATRQSPEDLLRKYECLIEVGACYCSMSRRFIEWECRHCQPYPWFLADLDETKGVRSGQTNLRSVLKPRIADQVRGGRWLAARKMLLDFSEEVKQQMDAIDPCLGKELWNFPGDRFTRLSKILYKMSLDFHDTAVRSFPQWIRDPSRFCLSVEWMTWHRIRLLVAVIVDYMYHREKGDPPGNATAEHDYQDAEYVFLLSRADAIITTENREKGLVSPLARAAFPEKDVFSSLKEVPESYRCDGANG
jgi:hypothetical protein